MSNLTNGSIFDQLGFSDEEKAALQLKADIFNEILATIEKQNLESKELQEILGVPQPRVSELINGKISKVSIEKLISYLQALGKVPAKLKFKKVSGF